MNEVIDMYVQKTVMFCMGACLSWAAMGCAFTLPTPPDVSKDITKEKLSNAGRLVTEAAAQVAAANVPPGDKSAAEGASDLRSSIAADMKRCEERLNQSVNKMNLQRTSKGALTILGGALSVGAGIAAAVLTKSKLVQDTSTATALVAAGGGLVTIVTQLIGDPAGELQNYQQNLQHYNRAVGIAERIRLSDASPFAEASDYQTWKATQIRTMSTELRACADTQGSSVTENKEAEEDKDLRAKLLDKITEAKKSILPTSPSSTPPGDRDKK
jgi:hypothetical protein